MTTWHFTIPGEPKGRQESQAIGYIDPVTKAVRARNVQPKGGITKTFEAMVAMFARQALGHVERLDCPLVLDILAVFSRPEYLREPWHPDGLIIQASKPDRDNIEKAIQDGMKAEWRDDCRVSVGTTFKAYCERNGKPRTEVWLRAIGESERFNFHGHAIAMPGTDAEKAAYREQAKADRKANKGKPQDDRDAPKLELKMVEASGSPKAEEESADELADRLF